VSNSNDKWLKKNCSILKEKFEIQSEINESKHIKHTIYTSELRKTMILSKTTCNFSAKKKQTARLVRVLRNDFKIKCRSEDFFTDYVGIIGKK
jgi:hypothetical protein